MHGAACRHQAARSHSSPDNGQTHEFLRSRATTTQSQFRALRDRENEQNRLESRRQTHLDNFGTHAVTVTDLVHVALEVEVEELEDEVEFRVVVVDVEQPVARERRVAETELGLLPLAVGTGPAERSKDGRGRVAALRLRREKRLVKERT